MNDSEKDVALELMEFLTRAADDHGCDRLEIRAFAKHGDGTEAQKLFLFSLYEAKMVAEFAHRYLSALDVISNIGEAWTSGAP